MKLCSLFLVYNALVVGILAVVLPYIYFESDNLQHLRVSDANDGRAYGIKTTTAYRLFRSLYRQKLYTKRCPLTPSLEGKTAFVTGSNGGIGYETAKGMAQRGAYVILGCRSKFKCERARNKILETFPKAQLSIVLLDLADLNSVEAAVDTLKNKFGRIDVLVANAGVMPTEYSLSKQGYELAFAVNNLGHQFLITDLIGKGLIKTEKESRIIIVTGDIYVLIDECTPNFKFNGATGGIMSYSRSKLGNMWQAFKLAKLYPELSVYIVHPGVINSKLGSTDGKDTNDQRDGLGEWYDWLASFFVLDNEMGAQTTLLLASQALNELHSGSYYHNTMGRFLLPRKDIALNVTREQEFWETCSKIIDEWKQTRSAE